MRPRPFHGLVQSSLTALGIGHPQHRVGGKKTEEGFMGFVQTRVADIGNHCGAGHFGYTQLRSGFKLPDRVHLIAEELNAVRMVKAVGEDVHDASTHAVLTGFVDEVNFFKFVGQKHFVEKIHGVGFPDGDGEGLVAKFLAGDDLFGEGFRKGDNAQSIAAAVDFVQHLGAHGHVGVFDGLFFAVRHPCGAWIEQNGPVLVHHRLQVVHEVGSLLLVVQHKHVVPRLGPLVFVAEKSSNAEGDGGTDGPVHFHFCTWLRDGTTQCPVSGVAHVELKEVRGPHEAAKLGDGLAGLGTLRSMHNERVRGSEPTRFERGHQMPRADIVWAALVE